MSLPIDIAMIGSQRRSEISLKGLGSSANKGTNQIERDMYFEANALMVARTSRLAIKK